MPIMPLAIILANRAPFKLKFRQHKSRTVRRIVNNACNIPIHANLVASFWARQIDIKKYAMQLIDAIKQTKKTKMLSVPYPIKALKKGPRIVTNTTAIKKIEDRRIIRDDPRNSVRFPRLLDAL